MSISKIENIKITGIAAAVSNKWTSLTDFATGEADEKTIKKFMRTTGVKGRYEAGKRQTTSDFCYAAAKELLVKKSIDPEDIGIIVFLSQTSDYDSPATACVLQYRLGLSEKCIAFDINLGCSGYTYGINIISSVMMLNHIKKGLFLCGDTSAKRKNSQWIKTTNAGVMLFGDSGTATLLENSDENVIYSDFRTDGSGFRSIIIPYEGWRNPNKPMEEIQANTMDDMAVFEFSTSKVPDLINAFMGELSTRPADYDSLDLHQANLLIIKQIAKKTGFEMEKTLVSIDEFGNTSSASIPDTLVKHYGKQENSCDIHTLMCGYGVGLSWSVLDTYINTKDILPLVHTDEYFEDGYYV